MTNTPLPLTEPLIHRETQNGKYIDTTAIQLSTTCIVVSTLEAFTQGLSIMRPWDDDE